MEYVISVRNEEESRKAQEILFAAGCSWVVYGQKPSCLDKPFLYVGDNAITWGNSFACATIDESTRVNFEDVERTFPPIASPKMIKVGKWSLSEETLEEIVRKHFA